MAAPAIVPAFKTENGAPHPLGATIQANGVNFSLFSGSATGVELRAPAAQMLICRVNARSIVVLVNKPI